MYKLEPKTIENVKTLSQGYKCSESAVVEKALRWYITALEDAHIRIANQTLNAK